MERVDDIQYRLLREGDINPSYINKNLNKKYSENILNNKCLTTISKSEIDKYTSLYKPYQICEFTAIPKDDSSYSLYYGLIRRKTGKYSYNYSYLDCGIYEYLSHNSDFNEKSITMDIDVSETPFSEVWNVDDDDKFYNHEDGNERTLPDNAFSAGYDLVTSYYIFKNRLSCNKNTFAKKTVIDTLEYVYSQTDPLKLLFYLMCNASIMGINVPMFSVYYNRDDEDYDDNRQLIDETIDQLYPRIMKYLDILDDEPYVSQPKYVLQDAKKFLQYDF